MLQGHRYHMRCRDRHNAFNAIGVGPLGGPGCAFKWLASQPKLESVARHYGLPFLSSRAGLETFGKPKGALIKAENKVEKLCTQCASVKVHFVTAPNSLVS